MISVLRELFGHEAWADAEQWRAIEGLPAASEDREIRERLHHLHVVQRAYLKLLVGDTVDLNKELEPFPSLDHLQVSVRRYHEKMADFLARLAPHRLVRLLRGVNPDSSGAV